MQALLQPSDYLKGMKYGIEFSAFKKNNVSISLITKAMATPCRHLGKCRKYVNKKIFPYFFMHFFFLHITNIYQLL